MPLITNGFESEAQLNDHFQEHGGDFRASNATDYEQMADAFLGGSKPETVHECIRSCGMKLRYDPADEAFGIIDRENIIKTYFKPVPCSSLPGALRASAKQSGRCHPCANNLVYFKTECKK
jgi:pyocin large subunit-like protein